MSLPGKGRMQSGDGWVVFTQKVAFKLMGTQRGGISSHLLNLFI